MHLAARKEVGSSRRVGVDVDNEVRPPCGAKKSREHATRNINCYPRTTGP
jgi:hypothetical protein